MSFFRNFYIDSNSTFLISIEKEDNNNNETPENGTGKVADHPVMIEAGNPIAILLIALITLVSDRVYRKR